VRRTCPWILGMWLQTLRGRQVAVPSALSVETACSVSGLVIPRPSANGRKLPTSKRECARPPTPRPTPPGGHPTPVSVERHADRLLELHATGPARPWRGSRGTRSRGSLNSPPPCCAACTSARMGLRPAPRPALPPPLTARAPNVLRRRACCTRALQDTRLQRGMSAIGCPSRAEH